VVESIGTFIVVLIILAAASYRYVGQLLLVHLPLLYPSCTQCNKKAVRICLNCGAKLSNIAKYRYCLRFRFAPIHLPVVLEAVSFGDSISSFLGAEPQCLGEVINSNADPSLLRTALNLSVEGVYVLVSSRTPIKAGAQLKVSSVSHVSISPSDATFFNTFISLRNYSSNRALFSQEVEPQLGNSNLLPDNSFDLADEAGNPLFSASQPTLEEFDMHTERDEEQYDDLNILLEALALLDDEETGRQSFH